VHGAGGAPACSIVTVCDATVMVPVRADPALRSMLIATDPFPEPEEPETTSIQLTPRVAFHAHPGAEVTLMDLCPPVESMEIAVGETPYVQLGVGVGVGVGAGGVGSGGGVGVGVGAGVWTAAWFTRNVASPSVTVPVRACDVLVATTTLTVALPTPEVGIGLLIQSTLLRAFHEQPGVALNDTGRSLCAEGASADVGETVYWHGAGACVTSTVWSDTARWPCRRVPFGFGCTVYPMVAWPCPLVALRLIH
jgi:hypothetical protein